MEWKGSAMKRPSSFEGVSVQTGRKALRKDLARVGAFALTGVLVLSSAPLYAFAEGAPAAPSGQSQPGEPPTGGAGGMGQGGGADTMVYDYTGTLSGILVADGT